MTDQKKTQRAEGRQRLNRFLALHQPHCWLFIGGSAVVGALAILRFFPTKVTLYLSDWVMKTACCLRFIAKHLDAAPPPIKALGCSASGAVCIKQTAQRSGISLWLMFHAVELRKAFEAFLNRRHASYEAQSLRNCFQ